MFLTMFRRLVAVLLSLALPGAVVMSLYCNQASMAAMACCRTGMAECNRPGKMEDCCRATPAGKENPSAAVQAAKAEKKKGVAPVLLAALLAAPADSCLDGLPLDDHRSLLALPTHISPPRSPVLRI